MTTTAVSQARGLATQPAQLPAARKTSATPDAQQQRVASTRDAFATFLTSRPERRTPAFELSLEHSSSACVANTTLFVFS
jgi:hypothetical protein